MNALTANQSAFVATAINKRFIDRDTLLAAKDALNDLIKEQAISTPMDTLPPYEINRIQENWKLAHLITNFLNDIHEALDIT